MKLLLKQTTTEEFLHTVGMYNSDTKEVILYIPEINRLGRVFFLLKPFLIISTIFHELVHAIIYKIFSNKTFMSLRVWGNFKIERSARAFANNLFDDIEGKLYPPIELVLPEQHLCFLCLGKKETYNGYLYNTIYQLRQHVKTHKKMNWEEYCISFFDIQSLMHEHVILGQKDRILT